MGASAAWHALVAAGTLSGRLPAHRALAAILANHMALSLAGCAPRTGWLGPNLSRLPEDAGDGSIPDIALSFDDGPDPDVTPWVARQLEERGLRATFFCIGRRMERAPQMVRDLHHAGHRIENHTYHHRSTFAFSLLPALARELRACQDVATTLTGRAPAWFRAPAGMRNPLLERALAAQGLHYVSWTRRGFDTASRDPDAVFERLTKSLRRGDILLLHDGNAARTQDGAAVALEVLPRLLDLLEARGLRAGPLPDPEILARRSAASLPAPPLSGAPSAPR